MTTAADNQTFSLRKLPPVHGLLDSEPAKALRREFSAADVRGAVRAELDGQREHIRHNGAHVVPFELDAFFQAVRRRLDMQSLSGLQRVINATGIVLHTNMGRAPLSPQAVEAVRAVAQGYSNLELDLDSGKRGGRGGRIEPLLRELTGGAAALVVNNGAAAVLLALVTLAQGGEVVISRGELVEIGGGFRIPDVIAQSGARLVEVGTTNKTRLSDYADAITPDTKVLLKVHASNYRIVGFHSKVGIEELVALGRERGLPVIQDLGSGALVDLAQWGLPHEPTVKEAVRAGLDVVAFSGDKLLGGPQSGLLVGRADAITRMGHHPLFRALRADKMTLAALEATLELYTDDARLAQTLPVLRLLSQPPDMLKGRARRLRAGLIKLGGLDARIADGLSFSGGGTLPEMGLPSQHVHVQSHMMSVESLADALRHRRPAVMGMLADGAFVMDVRTVRDDEVAEIVRAFREVRLPQD